MPLIHKTFVDRTCEVQERLKCSVPGCDRYRALYHRKGEDGKPFHYQYSRCSRHRADGTLWPCTFSDKVREDHWLQQGILLTVIEYDELFMKQGGCCALCGVPQSRLKRRFDVDHNHESGEIRGLLCQRCNALIGIVDKIGLELVETYLCKSFGGK